MINYKISSVIIIQRVILQMVECQNNKNNRNVTFFNSQDYKNKDN